VKDVHYDVISGVIAGLQKVYPHFSVMPHDQVHETEEKLRAHFCTRGPPQRLDYCSEREQISGHVVATKHTHAGRQSVTVSVRRRLHQVSKQSWAERVKFDVRPTCSVIATYDETKSRMFLVRDRRQRTRSSAIFRSCNRGGGINSAVISPIQLKNGAC